MFSRLYRRLFNRTVEEVVLDGLRVGAFFTYASIPAVYYLNKNTLKRIMDDVDPHNTNPFEQKLQKHMESAHMRLEYEQRRIDYMNNHVAIKSFALGGVLGLCGGYSIILLLGGTLSFMSVYHNLLLLTIKTNALMLATNTNTYTREQKR